ncbi:hypothetical protein DFA_02387 [Cavenderia fasciculata]|uniref:Uncharacterized protein n=1 Tax=Cavenderia fasciculata TaxID=261658 RepID=F4PZB1_CACFS|nr:uncharacterized protein DFA_02387 [Cavenderia fasciculata]EGG19140.1 hypothetical protein DFA_02387 [Cavenderia fasciculata]|eukprot:XP_004366773.1 hypothetical protein DFA_02387 [Cavenderia fasciculata]
MEDLDYHIEIRDLMIDIPQVTKNLYLVLDQNSKLGPKGIPIFSISSRVKITKPQWLPHNTTHLTCDLRSPSTFPTKALRLDETNVRYLIIDIFYKVFQFSIQRLIQTIEMYWFWKDRHLVVE